MKILITGANGYIGKSIFGQLNSRYHVTALTRRDFDLSNHNATHSFLKNRHFDVVIHCAISGGSRLKSDSSINMDSNLMMYYNLLQNRASFNRLINIGSGAEVHQIDTPYGLSKHVIRKSILEKDDFYNVRVFNVFDQNELNTRFIKTCIQNYVKRTGVEIFNDRLMDFFYMQDLITLLIHYIDDSNPPKEIDCCYERTLTLLEIAEAVNTLDQHAVPISIRSTERLPAYSGEFQDIGLKFVGLKKGLQNVYSILSSTDDSTL
jgi:dTDP-4-dehydrorhamnose reductase